MGHIFGELDIMTPNTKRNSETRDDTVPTLSRSFHFRLGWDSLKRGPGSGMAATRIISEPKSSLQVR